MCIRLLFIFLSYTIVYGGVTGKINGTIKNQETGEYLAGVNIVVNGTVLGAATNERGEYYILNVPSGTYTLTASMIGYAVYEVTGVKVSMDITETINMALSQEVIGGEAVTVTAEKPLIKKDEFASRHLVSSEEIQEQPVDNFISIAKNQAGVVGSHFRGGRTGEVLILVDGVPIRDPAGAYSGSLGGFTGDIPEAAIQEMEVTLGGFSAEYGNVQSGVINLAAKEGGDSFHGSYRIRTTDFGSGMNKLLMGDRSKWLGAFSESYDPDSNLVDSVIWQNHYQHKSEQVSQFDISGPLPLNGNFFLSGEITDVAQGLFINQQAQKNAFQGKVTFRINPKIKFAVGGLLSRRNWDNFYYPASKYGPGDKYPYNEFQEIRDSSLVKYIYVENPSDYEQGLFSPDTSTYMTVTVDSIGVADTTIGYDYFGVRTYYVAGMQEYLWNHKSNHDSYYGIWTHALSPKTFYEIRYQISNSNYERGTTDIEDRDNDNDLAEYLEWDTEVEGPFPEYRDREDNYWWIRGDDRGLRDQNTTSHLLKLDINSQVTFNHLIKAGIDFQQHTTNVENITWGAVDTTDGAVSLGRLRKDIWEQNALDLGIYAQDKIEFQGITALVGMRYDFFDPTGRKEDIYYPGNYEEPFSEMDENNIPIFLDPQSPRAHSQISPRVGLSFPLTDNDIMYFTYGHYFQRPDAYYLYRNNQFQSLTKVGNYIGNPGLLPEKTVSYEAGVEHLIRNDIKLSLTGFSKDVTNLINWQKYVGRTIQNIEMNVFTNADYSNIKGLELSLEKRFNGIFGFSMNYSYSIAKGRSSDQWGGSGSFTSAKRLSILDYDQTHTFNSIVSLMTPISSIFGIEVLGMKPLSDWKINFITKYGSGLPYTSYGSTIVNNMRRPATINTDVRVIREIKIGPISLFVTMDIFNLMDKRNVDYIGSSLLYEQTDDPTLVRSDELTGEGEKIYYQNPQIYSDPRQFRLGVSVAF